MPQGRTSSPLVEPDVRITLIRLSQKRSAESMRRQLHGVRSEVPQAHALAVLISRDPFRRSKGPLAAPSQVSPETEKDMTVDLIESVAGVPEAEVVRPASQVSIQLFDQDRDRLPTVCLAGPQPQLFPFSPRRCSCPCFAASVRLHPQGRTGHLQQPLTRPNRVHLRYGSRVRFARLRRTNYFVSPSLGYLSNGQLQGKLLSAYKISQVLPGTPPKGRNIIAQGVEPWIRWRPTPSPSAGHSSPAGPPPGGRVRSGVSATERSGRRADGRGVRGERRASTHGSNAVG